MWLKQKAFVFLEDQIESDSNLEPRENRRYRQKCHDTDLCSQNLILRNSAMSNIANYFCEMITNWITNFRA